jgi:hypothetical protein
MDPGEDAVATPPSLPHASGVLRQDGLRVVDGDGNAVTLRGVNLGGWLMWEGWIWGGLIDVGGLDNNSESHILESLTSLVGEAETRAFQQQIYARFITEDDIERIAQLGYDSVRVPFNHRLLEDDAQPFVYREEGWAVLDRLLDWCARHGIHAVLDMHSAPGGQGELFVTDPEPTNLWRSTEHEERTIALWRAIAERYRDRAWLAGYDLLNEPTVLDGERLRGLYERVLSAIREVDDNHIAFLEGNWSAVIFDPFTRKPGDNIVYSLHQYGFSGRDLDADLAMAVSLAQRQQVPLWVGEYGEDSAQWVADRSAVYAATPEVVGWASWTWKRTGTDHPVPQEIATPPAWSGVILWITAPGLFPRPSPAQTRAGMAEFLEAIDLARCTQDTAFVEATL